MKILHAPNNIIGQMGSMARALREAGHFARSCSYRNKYFQYMCDECLDLDMLESTSIELAFLPEEFEPTGLLNKKFVFDKDAKMLTVKGFMTERHQEKLLILSRNFQYQSAIKQLFKKNRENKEIFDSRISSFYRMAAETYDIFHFHCGETLLSSYEDLPDLKSKGKRMVMQFWGSEVRQKSIFERKNPYFDLQILDEKTIKKRLERISEYIHTVIASDYELVDYVTEYFDKVVVVRPALFVDEYKTFYPSPENDRPLIVHAPSHKDLKGTEYVLNVISELSKNYDLEFKLIHGLANDKAKEIYAKADIVIDQLLLGSYGFFAIEAMAMGKPVLSYVRDDLQDKYPGLPVISVTVETLYNSLKDLIVNPELRNQLGKQGRAYVEQNHNILKIVKQLINLYSNI